MCHLFASVKEQSAFMESHSLYAKINTSHAYSRLEDIATADKP